MISVIMPVYNNSKFLEQSIDGILNQTEKDFEFIIVNDGSTDNSEDIILSYDDPRIVYVSQENQGVASARNKGLDMAKGDFIAWQDADDISLPIRLEIMRKGFVSDAVGFVHCDMLLVDEKGSATGYWQSQNITSADMFRFFLKIGTPFNNASTMMRKELFHEFQHDTSLKIGSDSDMIFSVTKNWESVHIPEPLYIYRRHSNNLTKKFDYEQLAAHIRKLLSRHSLQELVPELSWQSIEDESNPEDADNRAKACAVISLLLSRREMKQDADKWLERADESGCGISGKLFTKALSLMQSESYALAKQILQSNPVQDCVTDNYLGEISAIMGNENDAYKYFMSAISKNPDYSEPVDNLRSLGGAKNLQLVDITWLKYRNAS